MALTDWADLTLCTWTDITNVVTDMDTALIMDNPAQIQSLALQKRDNIVKSRMLQELQVVFQQRYPKTTAQWINYAESMLSARKERAQYQFSQSGVNAITPPVGYYQIYFGAIDMAYEDFVLNYGVPRTYYNYGIPTASTYAGQAASGSMLVESQYQRLYIQRGTLAVPDWQYFIPKDLKDYIADPTVLTLWAASATLLACVQDGQFRSYAKSRTDTNAAFLMEMEPLITKRVAQDKALALQLIDVDLAGDGSISEFSSSSNQDGAYFA